jgi:hypothetical protein
MARAEGQRGKRNRWGEENAGEGDEQGVKAPVDSLKGLSF